MSTAELVRDLEAERHYQIIAGPIVSTKDARSYAIEDKAYMCAALKVAFLAGRVE